MESIKSAYLSLKNGATKSKSKANKDVNSTIDKLSDVLDILKLSTVSDTVFLKLSNLLRQTIQPLYEHELDLTLNLSSAIFLAVHNVKVVTSVDRASRKTWENVQSSVLSGLLDHLDEHRTAKSKASVGKAFFTSLSKLYFPKSPEQRIDCSSDLHTTVFMLLSEIVCGQSANASTLRNELNGGRRLGYAILNLRDFLPLEAALELFANILLALRGANSRSERLKFTQYVFDSQFFSSPTLLGGLAKITSADQWSDISSEVMKTIASLNAEFPQPFEISDFQLKGFKSRGPDNIFLESTAVVGSIPVPGGDDTLIIPFPFISGLQMASSGGEAVVKVSLNAPPIIGKKPINCDLEDIFVEWKVQKQDIKRFSETLKSRKVPFDFSNFQHSRKLSIAQKGLSLEFNGSEDAPPPNATQEKAISIAKLWDESEAHRGVGQTSPLMHAIFPPSTGDAKGRPPVPVAEPSVFIDSEGNLTDQLARTAKPEKAIPSALAPGAKVALPKKKASDDILISKAIDVLMSARARSQEESNASQPKRGTTRSKANVVVSDEESEVDQYDPPSPTPAKAPSLRLGPSKAKKFDTKPLATVENEPSVAPAHKKPPELKEEQTEANLAIEAQGLRRNLRPRKSKSPEKQVSPKAPTTKKRPSPELVLSDDEPPLPPAKKQRLSPSPPPKARNHPVTRYRGKARGSSPAVTNLEDDYDDPPKPAASKLRSRAKPEEGPKRKKMAMKDKSGKPKPRPVPVNKRKTAASNKKAIEDMDFDITLVDTVKKENSTRAQSAMKPKVKPTSVKMETVTPFSKKEGTKVKPSTNKPKKAVWQRDSFMANVNLQKQSTPARAVEDVPDPISEDSSQAPPGAFDFDSEPVAVEISDETTGGSETFVMDPPLAEYFVPIKGEPESSPIFLDEEPMVVKKEDAVMIDLTSPPNTTKTPARVATPAPVVTAKRPLRSTRARSEMKPEPKPEAIRTEKTREENVVERSLRLEPKPNVRKEMTGEEKAVEEPQRVLVKLEARKDKVREEKIVQRPVRIEVEPEVRAEKPQEEKVIAQPHYIEVEPEEETHAKRVVNEQRRSEVQPARMPEKIALQTPGGAWPDRAHIPIPETGKRTQIPKLTLPSLRPLANVQARFSPPRRMKEPIMDIPEILGKINEALVDRIQGKFDKTRNEMTLAQLALLEQAADDLRPLSKECAISFNELVDLEEEYATHRRKIMNSIDTFGKTANQAAGTVKQITQDHSRYGLSKKLPPKVFSKPFQLRL